ncbi:hypothetical protein, partial [Thauera sp. SDU_THAU2]|uniref:hypothetical protein n=1 Tax=Thauera sp. SDU_THAU2 TaxID=3136633 RepID=UPI00311F095A
GVYNADLSRGARVVWVGDAGLPGGFGGGLFRVVFLVLVFQEGSSGWLTGCCLLIIISLLC